jgi:endonuclease/exonuclease/phosphatase family metal-dependent hydrolase
MSVWRVSGRPDRTPYGWRGWAESDAVRRRFRGGSRLPVGRRWTAAAGVPLLLIGLLLGACGNSGRTVTVVSYNVQNLYDATDDGGEYREYTAAGGWNEALYTAKLRALGSALRSAVPAGADLVALQEVEHAGAARRLVNLELSRQGYRHVVWLPDPRSATGPVVLSKLPVRRVGALWVEGSPEQPLRPILEVEVALGEAVDAPSLFLFNNHWKSKNGGAAETEVYRRRAAALLAVRLQEIGAADPAAEILVVGDLNESIDEYDRQERRYATALMPAAAPAAAGGLRVTGSVPPAREPMELFSPWLVHDAGAAPPGSYRYRGAWETIDHLLLGPGLFDERGLSYAGGAGFAVIHDGLLDAGGSPQAFYRGPPTGGHSDHLPLRLELTLHPPAD